MIDFYIVLIDNRSGEAYVSKNTAPIAKITCKSIYTIRSWLRKPDIALKQGYTITKAERLKSNQGGHKPRF